MTKPRKNAQLTAACRTCSDGITTLDDLLDGTDLLDGISKEVLLDGTSQEPFLYPHHLIPLSGTISPHTNAFLAFWLSLAPWSSLDRSGKAPIVTFHSLAQSGYRFALVTQEFIQKWCDKRKRD